MKTPPPLAAPVRELVPLAPFTTWKIGGPARWLAEPSGAELAPLLSWAQEEEVPVWFLGRGSNVLIPDAGLPGLVILTRNSLCGLSRVGDHIHAESGVSLMRLSKFAASEGFRGFEFMIGIPGTVGGALAVNAGLTVFRPRDMSSVTEDFEVITLRGVRETLSMGDVHACYRHTDLLDGGRFVASARFRLEETGDPAVISRETLEHLHERKRKQPLDKPTAGSTFKSVPEGKGAGFYVEQAGLKGFRIGAAQVSNKHANWIENLGGATAADVRELISVIQSRVSAETGVRLDPEVIFLQEK
ncbi:MAG: UDP-N-acetylmuramate dehydrogenase [Verrucomicrobiota bacterium]